MKDHERFVVVYKENLGFGGLVKILADKQTGVQYVYSSAGYSGGMTVLVDAAGKPLLYHPSQYPR